MRNQVRRFLESEITNERHGGESPATLATALDSLHQGGPEIFGLNSDDLAEFTVLTQLVASDCLLTDIL